ncbi:MAG: NAD(P)/FAD-dependent oxidoreductase [Kouleothrix sp.]
MYDMIVIGGGPAGVTAALRACELGASVALLDRSRVGGTCTNDGCVPTRVLAKAARLVRDAEQFAEYGIVGAQPVIDFPRLLAQTRQIVDRVHEKKHILDHLAAAGATVYTYTGGAHFVDPHTVALSSQTTLQADKFIVAAGGRPRSLRFPGSEYTLNPRDVWSMTRLPRSIAIVGGAATGCQLASIFAAFGVEVRLLEVAPRILSYEDEVVSLTVAEAFRQRGIELITEISGVERVERRDDGLAVHYLRAGCAHVLPAEAVILATGWAGNADELNLAAAEVAHERGYVLVDDALRTSAPHIFAAGDITGRMMLVQSGSQQGRIAAENALLGLERASSHQIVPHGGFTDPEYGSVGQTEQQARAGGDYAVAVVPYADLDRAVVDGRTLGCCKLIASRSTHKILGAHVVGEQAVEAVQMIAAGMAAGMQVEQLAELELAYPTYTAILGLAARQIQRDLGTVPVTASWRALGHLRVAEWERSIMLSQSAVPPRRSTPPEEAGEPTVPAPLLEVQG